MPHFGVELRSVFSIGLSEQGLASDSFRCSARANESVGESGIFVLISSSGSVEAIMPHNPLEL